MLDLMTDDIVFLVPGEEPFGKAAFEAMSAELDETQIDGTVEVQEVRVLGDWAYRRNHIEVTMTPTACGRFSGTRATRSKPDTPDRTGCPNGCVVDRAQVVRRRSNRRSIQSQSLPTTVSMDRVVTLPGGRQGN